MAIHVQCGGCGGKFNAPEKLAGKRVKCPKCGRPLAVPGVQPAAARPAGDLDLDELLGAEAGPAVMPRAALPPLRKKQRRPNTGLIVGLSVGAGGTVLMLLLVFLLWPSGEDKELAKNEAAPNEQSQAAVQAPVDLKKEYPWLEGSAPFDVAEFLAPIPEAENAAPLYLEALDQFSLEVLPLLVPDKERRVSIEKQRRPAQTRRNDQYKRFDEAWGKDPTSVNLAEVDAWLAEYETGFKKLAAAQQRPRCAFPCPVDVLDFSLQVHAARGGVVPVAIWRNRRDLQRGDLERPLQSIETVLRLSRDIRHRGNTICQLVSVTGLDHICLDTMVREILLAPGLRREHCDRLLAVLVRHQAEAIDPFMENQRVGYLQARKLLYDFEHRTGIFDKQEMKKDSRFRRPPDWRSPDSPLSCIVVLMDWGSRYPLADKKFGTLDLSSLSRGATEKTAHMLELEQEIRAMTAVDYAREAETLSRVYGAVLALKDRTMLERSRACSTSAIAEPLLETNVAVFLNPFSRAYLPSVYAFLNDETNLRGTQCLVAIRRWQLDHREPPKDLETLVKAAGMKGVPIDPYSDQPLRMTLLQGEPVIYSVGKDGKDDRAQADWRYGQQPGDFVFRLQAPHKN